MPGPMNLTYSHQVVHEDKPGPAPGLLLQGLCHGVKQPRAKPASQRKPLILLMVWRIVRPASRV